ncbi:MAG: tetratricopeptide repeat protein, partial [Candidatus Eremiobacteraeota bacterium]|nr:tetratricopeptide repeat protein [Candidatus Eremiobacteraeota bacterium]
MSKQDEPLRPLIIAAFFCAVFAASFVAGPSFVAEARRPHAVPSPSPSPAGSPTPTPQERIATLSQTVKDNPNDRTAREELGVLLVQTDKAAQGRDQLENAIRLGANDAQVWFFIGLADRELGDAPDAALALQRAENLDPANQSVLTNLIDVYLQLGRLDDARRLADRAVHLHPTDAFGYEALASVQLNLGRMDDARKSLQQALKLDPKDARARILIARSYLADKKPNVDLALAQVNSVLASDPKNVDALASKSEALSQKNDVPGAVDALQQIAKLQPDRVDAQDSIAQLYLAKNMIPQARTAFAQARKDYPKAPEPYMLEAQYDAKNKNYAQAGKEYESALALAPDNLRLLFEYGRFELAIKQPNKAQDAFSKILSRQPNDGEIMFWLGQTYAAQNQWAQARDQYRRSFELSRTYPALFNLGFAFYNLKDYKSAREAFTALAVHQVREHPDPQLWFILGETNRHLGERKGAIAAYK